jgi:hypothetical protein
MHTLVYNQHLLNLKLQSKSHVYTEFVTPHISTVHDNSLYKNCIQMIQITNVNFMNGLSQKQS